MCFLMNCSKIHIHIHVNRILLNLNNIHIKMNRIPIEIILLLDLTLISCKMHSCKKIEEGFS